jgi:hypothetical protein
MQNRWDWVNDLKNELFDSIESTNLCIIAVDWEKLAQGYFQIFRVNNRIDYYF